MINIGNLPPTVKISLSDYQFQLKKNQFIKQYLQTLKIFKDSEILEEFIFAGKCNSNYLRISYHLHVEMVQIEKVVQEHC